MCHGTTSCPNGGTCIAPDQCSCTSGFTGSHCTGENHVCSVKKKYIVYSVHIYRYIYRNEILLKVALNTINLTYIYIDA